ncbi:hypothetical protein ACNKHQ_02300 [Shigella flexneri]
MFGVHGVCGMIGCTQRYLCFYGAGRRGLCRNA